MNSEAMDRFLASLQPAFLAGDPASDSKPAEQSNVARLRYLYEAFRAGDGEALKALLAEDVELEITGPPSLPLAGRWQGREEVLAAAGRNFGLLEDQKPELLTLVAQGDSVMLLARERGRLRETGQEYEIHLVQHYTFEEGSIRRIVEFCDNPAALSAA